MINPRDVLLTRLLSGRGAFSPKTSEHAGIVYQFFNTKCQKVVLAANLGQILVVPSNISPPPAIIPTYRIPKVSATNPAHSPTEYRVQLSPGRLDVNRLGDTIMHNHAPSCTFWARVVKYWRR